LFSASLFLASGLETHDCDRLRTLFFPSPGDRDYFTFPSLSIATGVGTERFSRLFVLFSSAVTSKEAMKGGICLVLSRWRVSRGGGGRASTRGRVLQFLLPPFFCRFSLLGTSNPVFRCSSFRFAGAKQGRPILCPLFLFLFEDRFLERFGAWHK